MLSDSEKYLRDPVDIFSLLAKSAEPRPEALAYGLGHGVGARYEQPRRVELLRLTTYSRFLRARGQYPLCPACSFANS